MSGVRDWVAARLERWLLTFKSQHDLSHPQVDQKTPSEAKLLLHLGCGISTMADITVPGFDLSSWRELRLDADASVKPDMVCSMTDMVAVESGVADAIFSSHGIEHLYWHDVPKALKEFFRVLDDQGFAVITCPDLQAAAAMIAEDRMFDTAYESAAGSITPFDILYSYRPFVERNPQWMSHHCGFTLSTLFSVLKDAGFPSVAGFRRPAAYDLWVLASKSKRSEDEMRELISRYLIQTT